MQVHLNWKKKLVAMTLCDTSRQVGVCLEMALRCSEDDQMKRPPIAEIVKELNKLNTAESSFTGEVYIFTHFSHQLFPIHV